MKKTNKKELEDICPKCGKPLDLTMLHAIDRKTGEKICLKCAVK